MRIIAVAAFVVDTAAAHIVAPVEKDMDTVVHLPDKFLAELRLFHMNTLLLY